ncbi:wciY domain protein [Streptococcus pneumoniae 2070335]|nr:wciY domain protein [Streptococcus pneumoniae 2070335]
MPIQSNKIIFDNFGGRGFGDNPKYILEELVSREKNLDLVWVTKDREISIPEGVRVVKYGSYRSFYEWLTARVWVDNIRNSDRPWKRKGQIYLQTWHGSDGVKLIEKSVAGNLKKHILEWRSMMERLQTVSYQVGIFKLWVCKIIFGWQRMWNFWNLDYLEMMIF